MYIKFKGVKIMEVDIKKDVDVKEAVLTNPEKKTTKRKTTKAVKKVASMMEKIILSIRSLIKLKNL